MHRALKAVEAKEAKARNLKEAGVCLYVAAANLNRKAARHPFEDAKAKQDLADALEDLDEKTKELAAMYAACGVDDAEALAAQAQLAEMAAAVQAQEAALRVELKERLDAIVEALKGRWGTEAAHPGLVSFLIEGTKSKLATLAEEAGVTELGTVRLYRGKTMTIGASFVVPTRFATNGSVGPNMFLFKKVDGRWVALTGSAVNKNDLKTIMWYRLAKKAVNERADIKESIRALLLKSLEASGASGASGPESPWHAVLSKGTSCSDFTLDVFIHERKSSTVGLAMYQLALVPTAESMTAELAETMATVKKNMTAGAKAGEAARYFTLAMKRESGEQRESGEPADEEMGSERQPEGDEQDEQDEAEVVGRMASVSASASSSRKRKSVGSVHSVESGAAKPVDHDDELDEAIEKAMESGRAGLAEDADEDTRIAFFVKGAERSNGPGGLEEQIQAKVKAGGIRQLSLSSDAVSMELRELEEKQGNLRVAMQEATARVEASKVHSALVQMRVKRQRS